MPNVDYQNERGIKYEEVKVLLYPICNSLKKE